MAWLPEPMMPYMVTSLWLAKTFAINYKGTITVSCSDKTWIEEILFDAVAPVDSVISRWHVPVYAIFIRYM